MILRAIYVLIILGGMTFVQLKTGFLPNILFKVFGGLIAIAVIIIAVKNYEFSLPTSNEELPAYKGFDRVQTYLKNHKGRDKLDDKKRDKIHEGTLDVDKNGEVHRLYAVIGREYVKNRKKQGDTIRVIWDLTEDDFVWFDGYVPPKHRTEPFYNRDKWLEVEGYKIRQDRNRGRNRNKESSVVIQNNPGGGQNSQKPSYEEENEQS